MSKWKIAGAEVIGRKHIKNGTPCQDKVFSLNMKGVSVIALSDGAGSRELSQIGAQVSVETVCNIFATMFDKLFRRNTSDIAEVVLKEVRNCLENNSLTQDVPVKELASTLLFVAISRGRYVSGHIGDGVIAKLNSENLSVHSYPDNGEYSNETYFTTSSDALERFRVDKGFIKDESGFLLMSDGSADSLYDKRRNFLSPVSSQMMKWLDTNSEESVTDALRDNLTKFISMKTFDDCSIVMMRNTRQNKSSILRHLKLFVRDIRIKIYEVLTKDTFS